MKTILNLILLVLIGASASAQQISGADLQVTGLTCSMCSKATETSLKTLDFIETITPDLNKNIFVLTFKKDRNVNIDLVKKKVEDAGFSVGGLEATMNFNNAKIDEDGQAVVGGNVYRFINAKNKTLNGPVKATVLDKDFLSAATFKKNAAKFNSDAYTKGTGVVNGKKARIYHLSI